ncbi:MAG TPA: GMC family oxidoreductase [Gammaproteobacteria bacterium]|jgi:choline dehydrogenase-like flavoprotein|nr:oxidoreductase [Chromatiales bacterium]MCP4926173.1 GMC family oxidoreductase [Gammaproteobacteria bacterium]MDP7153862.1 GMC family oxidoreductase [Gammaproteobacteria bacterium]MDP7296621.1 GMC family oxidoreductase [Gammaproteobacteria bacterium]MDP7660911.1 GMC family oxidoreductase [Gammaproteobacteria bacterium]
MNSATEVIIVGAGAAGSVYAAILAEAGRSVTVLDGGPPWQLTDLYSSQSWARRLKWAEPHAEEHAGDSLWFNFNAGRGYGGAALHHFGVWPRYHEADFKESTLYGRGLDWPLEYQDLRPYYDRVQADIGIAGDAEAEIWRPDGDPYPLPPVPRFAQGDILQKGFELRDMHTAPVPMAVLTRPYKGRNACLWDGWCEAGCPIGALGNPHVEYIPRALQAGAVLQPYSRVTRVLMDKRGRRATGVEYFDQQGERHTLHAEFVVLAAFGIENCRILFNSASAPHPDGLANSSGLVGAYVMSHTSANLFGMFDADTQNHMGLNGGQIINQDRFGKTRKNGPFGSRQFIAGLAVKPNDLLGIAMTRADLFGSKLDDFMHRAARNLTNMVTISEDQPLRSNRVELSGNKDAHGFSLARIVYQTSPDAKALWRDGVAEGKEILAAAGAKEIWNSPQGAQHIMGGTIMGKRSDESVTNKYSQTHDIDNLFIGGAGVFPTSSAANPTFTLHATSMMSAAYLRDNFDSL